MRAMNAILLATMSCAVAACAPQGGSADTPGPTTGASAPEPAADAATAPDAAPAPAPAQDQELRPLPGRSADGGADPNLQCEPEAAQSFVGKAATADVVEQARTAAKAQVARVLKPGQMVTMEYRAGRLNVDVDDNNVITNVRCG